MVQLQVQCVEGIWFLVQESSEKLNNILDVVLFFAGFGVAGLEAPLGGDEYRIVAGSELSLMALLDLLRRGQLRLFFQGLFVLGLMFPILAAATIPLFYHSGYSVDALLETAGVAVLPGAFVCYWAWKGFSVKEIPQLEEPSWLSRTKWLFRVGMTLITISLFSGEWNAFTVFSVISGGFIIIIGAVTQLFWKLALNRRSLGSLLMVLGCGVLALCLLLVATQGGRVSAAEVMVGIVPSGILLFLGFAIWSSKAEIEN